MKREGTIETVPFEGETAILTLAAPGSRVSKETVLLDRRTQVVANGIEVGFERGNVQLQPGQRTMVVGVSQEDGTVIATRVFMLTGMIGETK